MKAIYVETVHTTNFDMAAGQSFSVEKIDGDYVCSECGCYVDEIDEGVWYCRKCEVCS